MAFRPSKKSKSVANPLRGVIAFVDATNDDGSDASEDCICTLKSLGAIVATSFGEDLSHLIWSNGKQTRLAAAIIMGIRVVLPGWVDKCRESDKMTEEGEYLITSGLVATTAAAAALSLSKSPSSSSGHRPKYENSSAMNNHLGNLRISSFQNLQSICTHATAVAGNNIRNGKRSPSYNSRCASSSSSTKTSRISADSSALEVDCEYSMKQDVTSTSRSSACIDISEGASCHPFIPLPSYREHNTGVLPAELKVHRRSERICDLEGESSVAVDIPETLEDVLKINPDTPMAIIRVDEWPPVVDVTTAGNKISCRQLLREDISDQNRSEDVMSANIVISVSGWAETDDEESDSDQKYVESVREQILCLADRIYLSMCSTGITSCRKTKEKGKRRSLLLGSISGQSSPSPVHGSRAVVLRPLEDPLGATCTHLVCPLPQPAVLSKNLSLRVVFALAKGTPIVSSDWVAECSSKQDWKDVSPFLSEIAKRKKGTRKIFQGRTFYLGRSRHPTPKVITALIGILGGAVISSLKAAELMVLGDQEDALQWMELADSKLKRRAHPVKDKSPYDGAGKVSDETVALALGMAKKHSVLSWKYLCDCVIENEVLKPSSQSGHILLFEDLPVSASSAVTGVRTRTRTIAKDIGSFTPPNGSGGKCDDAVKRHTVKRPPVQLDPALEEDPRELSVRSTSQRYKPRSISNTLTTTSSSSVKGRGRPSKSQPVLALSAGKATSKVKKVKLQEVVIIRAMTRYRGTTGDSGSATTVGKPDEVVKVPPRHKKRKRAGVDEDTDFVPTASAAGRVGRVGRPDSPTW